MTENPCDCSPALRCLGLHRRLCPSDAPPHDRICFYCDYIVTECRCETGDAEMTEREDEMVVLRRHSDGTPAVWCDPDIADVVQALNAGGVPTVASCSGHGIRPGNVALADGRELIVAADWHEARRAESAFPGLS